MATLLKRSIQCVDKRLVLLAPPKVTIPGSFNNVTLSTSEHSRHLRAIQALRGGVYFADGALDQGDLTGEGLHRIPEDDRSWHLFMLNGRQVTSCVWYMEHENTTSADKLRARDCPAALRAESRETFREAIRIELARARRLRLRYAEIGGWAVSCDNRCRAEGLLLALAAYSLGRLLGGALGLTTATVRHSSATILKRLGGTWLQSNGARVGPYYDPRYRCDMELLRFDSRRPSPRYDELIDLLRERLAHVPVVAPLSSVSARHVAAFPLAAVAAPAC